VLQDEVAQRLGAGHGDVEEEVVVAAHMEDGHHAGQFDEAVVEVVDVLAAVASQAHLDDRVERAAEGLGVEVGGDAGEDARFAERAQAVRAGRLGDARAGRERGVRHPAVFDERGEDRQVGAVERRRLGLCFLRPLVRHARSVR